MISGADKVSVEWCSPDVTRYKDSQDAGPPAFKMLLDANGPGVSFNFIRQLGPYSPSNTSDPMCGNAWFTAMLMAPGRQLTIPESDMRSFNASTLPPLPDNQLYSFRTGYRDQPQSDISFSKMPIFQRLTDGMGPTDAFVVQFLTNPQTLETNVTSHHWDGPPAQYFDVRVHTIDPAYQGLVTLAAFETPNPNYHLEAAPVRTVFEAGTKTEAYLGTETEYVTAPFAAPVTLQFSGDAAMGKLLAASPLVSDTLAVASLSLFGLGTVALLARKLLARNNRAPDRAENQV